MLPCCWWESLHRARSPRSAMNELCGLDRPFLVLGLFPCL